MRYLEHGRVADVSRLQAEFGWGRAPPRGLRRLRQRDHARRVVAHEAAEAAEQKVLDLLAARRPAGQGAPVA
jgi:hypothetical protein